MKTKDKEILLENLNKKVNRTRILRDHRRTWNLYRITLVDRKKVRK